MWSEQIATRMSSLIWCNNFNENLAAGCWRRNWSEASTTRWINGWTDGLITKTYDWMNDWQIHTEMNDGLMMDGVFFFLLCYICTVSDRLCCLATPGMHAVPTAVHSPIICIWHKIYELQLTRHYYKLNWVISQFSWTFLLGSNQ